MLLLSEKLKDVPIMSLQTGTELARTSAPIIDPRDLSIPAFYVGGSPFDHTPSVLHTIDIREAGELGFIIDGSEKIMELDGLVRLQAILDLGFDIMKCTVHDRKGTKLGRVDDFSFDPHFFTVQQTYMPQPLRTSFSAASSIIARSQIVSISANKIIVDIPTVTEEVTKKSEPSSSFVNPFRAQSPQLDQFDNDQ